METLRKKYVSPATSAVIKLGTQLLSDKQGKLNEPFLVDIARQVVELRKKGVRVTLVSSGAIGSGIGLLKLPKRPTDLAKLQAVAAIGQPRLMDAWTDAFAAHGVNIAQLLLTRDDIDRRTRFLNLRNTLMAVHELGAVPIINENDSVSTDEIIRITFGDNDILASLVAHALRANLLILLTVVDGIQDANGQSVRLVKDLDQARQLVRKEKSALGKGGMDSKLQAAHTVTEAGEAMIVADGRMPNILTRLLAGEVLGTLFSPAAKKRSSRSRWIGSVRPKGQILVDEGCAKALVERGRSLLAAGITGITGEFERGDIVGIVSPAGQEIARGLTNYAAEIVQKIKGCKTAEVRTMLAEAAYDEVIHRNNLVLE